MRYAHEGRASGLAMEAFGNLRKCASDCTVRERPVRSAASFYVDENFP